jgi:hypothetical protein
MLHVNSTNGILLAVVLALGVFLVVYWCLSRSSDESRLLPTEVDVNAWCDKHLDSAPFDDCNTVRLAFRVAGTEKEHYINKWAAWLTRSRRDRFPAGRMCHAELILPVSSGKYVKCSVTKLVWDGTDENGKDKFKPGCVHCKVTSPSEWKTKYVFLCWNTKRRHIVKAIRFCMLNNGMPFNQLGFNANLLVPGGIGVHSWNEDLMTSRRRYFCTEFITTALLAMVSDDDLGERQPYEWQSVVREMNPATSSPNSLYRKLHGAGGVTDAVPLGAELSNI